MRATAIAHPNVALIKYWGKRDAGRNLPAVGSLSLTLGGLTSRTSVNFDSTAQRDSLLINGAADATALARATQCLDRLRLVAGVRHHASIESSNDFPTGAGLASSASGFAALITAAVAALHLSIDDELRIELARLGSGSAPRSLFGGIVLLEALIENDATPCRTVSDPDDWPLEVVVAVTTRERKAVASTGGMELSRATSPCYAAWVRDHPADLAAALRHVADRDFQALADIAEHNCLKMHAVAMTSVPALLYWSGTTLDCARHVQALRTSGVPVFFTIDAGPQLKAVCLPEAVPRVTAELAAISGVEQILHCSLGAGARVVA